MLSVDGFHFSVMDVWESGVAVRLVGVVGGVVSGVVVCVVPIPMYGFPEESTVVGVLLVIIMSSIYMF